MRRLLYLIAPAGLLAFVISGAQAWVDAGREATVEATLEQARDALGRFLPRPRTSGRALALAQRWGAAALLFSWLPVIGDALCVASGWLRHGWLPAAVAIGAGKAVRYVAVAAAVLAWRPAG